MLTPSKQVIAGLAAYAEKEMLPALEGWRMWTAAAALVLAATRADAIVAGLSENKLISALGLMDKDGNIDVDAALNALKHTARKQGQLSLDIPIWDITFEFKEKDIESLRGYIKNTAQNQGGGSYAVQTQSHDGA